MVGKKDDGGMKKEKKTFSLDKLGNVEALGIRAGEAFLMSQKHTLSNKRERERILETGRDCLMRNAIPSESVFRYKNQRE